MPDEVTPVVDVSGAGRPEDSDAQTEPDDSDSTDVAARIQAATRSANREATRKRIQFEQLEVKYDKLVKSQEAAARAKAEEDGEWKKLAEQERATAERERESRVKFETEAKERHLRSSIRGRLQAGGVPADMLDLIKLPTSGLTVSDSFEIEGDIDAALAPLIERFKAAATPAVATTPEPSRMPPKVIKTHPSDVSPQETSFAQSIASDLTKDGYTGGFS